MLNNFVWECLKEQYVILSSLLQVYLFLPILKVKMHFTQTNVTKTYLLEMNPLGC